MVGQIPLGENPLGQIPLGQVLLGLSTVGLIPLGQVTSPHVNREQSLRIGNIQKWSDMASKVVGYGRETCRTSF